MNLHVLAGRIEKLEQENRRLKLSQGVLILGFGVALLAAAVPRQVPEEIRAKVFRVVDDSGTVRAGLDATSLTIFDSTGAPRTEVTEERVAFASASGSIRAELTGERLGFADQDEYMRSEITHDRVHVETVSGERSGFNGEGFFVVDANGIARTGLYSKGLAYVDQEGNQRVYLGQIESVNPETGEVTYQHGVQIRDTSSRVVWEAPAKR